MAERLTLRGLQDELELVDGEAKVRDDRVLEASRQADKHLGERLSRVGAAARRNHRGLFAWTREGFGLVLGCLERLTADGAALADALDVLERESLETFEAVAEGLSRLRRDAQAEDERRSLEVAKRLGALEEQLRILVRPPRRVLGVARNEDGRLGLVTSFGTCTRVNGDVFRAFRGRHLLRPWWPWRCEGSPEWVLGPRWL